jgi:hypothetical protein
MSTNKPANHTSDAKAENHEKVADVTPIVPEQAKAENGESDKDRAAVDAEVVETKLEKAKAFVKKNGRFLIATGIAAAVTVLAVSNARKQAAKVEETDESADS